MFLVFLRVRMVAILRFTSHHMGGQQSIDCGDNCHMDLECVTVIGPICSIDCFTFLYQSPFAFQSGYESGMLWLVIILLSSFTVSLVLIETVQNSYCVQLVNGNRESFELIQRCANDESQRSPSFLFLSPSPQL